jgi:anti-anti-sigma factor
VSARNCATRGRLVCRGFWGHKQFHSKNSRVVLRDAINMTGGFQMVPLEIEVEKMGEDAVITLSGRLDMNTSPDFRKAALTLYDRRHCRNLTVDFAGVSYIDTSGLATLLEILVKAKERCAELTLSGLKGEVRNLIDVNGLTGFFRIEISAREKLPG